MIKPILTPQTTNFVNNLSPKSKLIAKYISLHEADENLAHVRFAQDTIVNWVPKVLFSRSMADFADMSFLELTENMLVYYGPKILGEDLFRKLYSKNLGKNLSEKVSQSGENLLKDKKDEDLKKLMPIKAAIAVSALAVPLIEYTLNYMKNIFTIKIFNKSDFNNIANLNKNQKEDKNQQKKVEDSAKKHIKLAGKIFAGCLALSGLLVTKGKNSKFLQNLSEMIVAPGNKIFKNNAQKAAKFNEYFSIDFKNNNGKLGLSKGQLTSCVVIGGFGYAGAAKDRGKQNLQEVLFRYPIVTFYVITGSEMFEKAYTKFLNKKGKCQEILSQSKMPKMNELPRLAKDLAQKNGTSIEQEFEKLFKQKATIIGAPLLFSLAVMGMFVAASSRMFTQYRYNKEVNNNFSK